LTKEPLGNNCGGGIVTAGKFGRALTVIAAVNGPPVDIAAVTVPEMTTGPDHVDPLVGPVTATPLAENDHWVTVALVTVQVTEFPRVKLEGEHDNRGGAATV